MKIPFFSVLILIALLQIAKAAPATNIMIRLSSYSLNTNQFDTTALPLTLTNISASILSGDFTNGISILFATNIITYSLSSYQSVNASNICATNFLKTSNFVAQGYATMSNITVYVVYVTNFIAYPTNYVAANFVPIAGMVKFPISNGVQYRVTQLSTNLHGTSVP